jgi:hypothetical protein
MVEESRGSSRATGPDPSSSVFINCPFDRDFEAILQAIVFTTTCCGFVPRSANESGTGSVPRMERIVHTIENSKYSIHDLSRCRGEGDANLARFNMPLELGIAMAQRFGRARTRRPHDWLLLVPAGHDYSRFLSDLAGYDPSAYDGTAEGVVPHVVGWLSTRPDTVRTSITPARVRRGLRTFLGEVNVLNEEWGGHLPWAELLKAAVRVASAEELLAAEASPSSQRGG